MDNLKLYGFKDDPGFMKKVEALARSEATTVSAIIRRALRKELSSVPSLPTSEQCAHMSDKQAA